MKRSDYHIICSWLLLMLFAAGQFVVYAHQHKVNTSINKVHHQESKQTVSEKCQLCDAMHYNSMLLTHHNYFKPVVVTNYLHITSTYDFTSIALILSAGRSSPLS